MQRWQSAGARLGITTRRSVVAMTTLALACFVAPMATLAQNAYITNANNTNGTVSVIDTTTEVVSATILVGTNAPYGVAVTPDGRKVYVANGLGASVSVIDTATNTVIGSPITVGNSPYGVAVTPDGSQVYVANNTDDTVSVIDTAFNSKRKPMAAYRTGSA